MRNPLTAVIDYLQGKDLQIPEQKLFSWPDPGALITPPTQITSGPAQWLLANPLANGSDFNSAVFACLLALAKAHIEAPLKVYQGDPESGTAEWLSSSPLQQLLHKPNPHHTNLELWFWCAWAKYLDGNAYLRKARAGNADSGNVIELWPLSPRLIKPMTNPGSDNLIDFYRYSFAPGYYEDIAPHNVIHFRIGIDDLDNRLGLAPIKRLVREIASDQAATQFTDALLRNFGVPGLVVEVPLGASLSDEQAEALKAKLENRFGLENRGNVGVLTAGAQLRQFGFSPDQLNLKSLHEVPETRIAAVMGVPPEVAGLGVGISVPHAYASLKQVREGFTELTVIPNWRMDQARLNHSLKPDFTSDDEVQIGYDLKLVRALQEDRTQMFTRLDNAVRTGWVMPNEARREVGLPPMEGGDEPKPQPLPGLPQPPAGPGQLQAPQQGPRASLPPGKELKAEVITAEKLEALVDLSAEALTEELQRYLDGQRRRLVRGLSRP
jgi:HK97 family phage portal protein